MESDSLERTSLSALELRKRSGQVYYTARAPRALNPGPSPVAPRLTGWLTGRLKGYLPRWHRSHVEGRDSSPRRNRAVPLVSTCGVAA